MTFFQQLSTLICSGTPLLQAIQISAEQSQSLKMRRVLEEIAGRVSAGSSLHAAAANYPQIFQNHWIEVIRTGEITGQMGPVLLELNKQIRETRETRRKVIGALMYPIILIVIAVTGRHRHAVAGRAHLRGDVQGHGRHAAGNDPVRRRCLRFHRPLRTVHPAWASPSSCWRFAST